MKKKPAKRKTMKKRAGGNDAIEPTTIPEKTLADVLGRPVQMEDESISLGTKALLLYGAPKVHGIPLPDDLFDVAGFVARQHFRIADNVVPEARDHALTEAICYAFRSGFTMALATYADDLKDAPRRNPRIMKAVRRLAEQEENGEMLAAEGRAAKAVNDRRRADLIRRLYKSVRPSFPDGRKGNGLAHRAVAERYETQTVESVSERTVRDTVNKAGLSAPRRRKRKD